MVALGCQHSRWQLLKQRCNSMLQAEIEVEIYNLLQLTQYYARLRKSGEGSKKDQCQPLLCGAVQQLTTAPHVASARPRHRAGIKGERKKKKEKTPSHRKPPIRLAIRGAGTSSKSKPNPSQIQAKQSYAPQPHRSALEYFLESREIISS